MQTIKARILRLQEEFKAVRDKELEQAIYKTYRSESRHSDKTIKEKGDVGRKNFWVTDVRRCPREIYYLFHESSKARPYTEKGLIIFADGTLHHRDLQGRLENYRYADHPGGYLKDPDLGTSGYYDDLFDLKTSDNGWKLYDIMEIKSKLSMSVSYVDQVDYDQLQYYIWMAQFSDWLREKKIRIVGGRLAYKDKSHISDDPYFCWRVDFDEDRLNEIREWFGWLKTECIDKKAICSRPYEYESIKCTYCLFREHCWKGIIPEPPEFEPDGSEPPEMELVQSAEEKYLELKEQESKVKEELKEVHDILIRYFKATGQEETEKLKYTLSKYTSLDEEYLKQTIGDKWLLIAKPQQKLIIQAIRDGEVDPEIFEKSKIVEYSGSIRIKKGENNADQEPK